MFINFWYVAATSKDIINEPYHSRMLGQDFVLYRDSEGQVHCLSDICTHRGAALSGGKVVQNNVQCPYHGWQFNGAGACARIPSEGPEVNIPNRAKVDSYPVIERYGLVHVFLGDLPEGERPDMMPIVEWEDDAWRFTEVNILDWNVNYMRSTENALDPSHAEFVHEGIFGGGGVDPNYMMPPIELIEDENRVGCMYTTAAVGMDDVQVTAGTIAYGPCHYVTVLNMNPAMQIRQYLFTTPIDERNERIYFISGRNFNLEEENDDPMDQVNLRVAEQDRIMLENVKPIQTPASSTEEILVRSDAIISAYRKWLHKYEALGYRIDSTAVDKAEQEGKKVFAIPSPARRKDKGWVIDPVPLT